MASFRLMEIMWDAVREIAEIFFLYCVTSIDDFMNLCDVDGLVWFLVEINRFEDTSKQLPLHL